MDVDGFEDLLNFFIILIEKLMDEFKGSVKNFRGLFKVPQTFILKFARRLKISRSNEWNMQRF